MSPATHDGESLAPVSFLPWVRDQAGADPGPASAPQHEPEIHGHDQPASEADQIEHDRVDKIVLSSLRRRGMSEWEVSEILRANEVPTEAWHEWIERYRLLGYLDDAQLAEQLVQTHHGRKGLGRQAVARELKARHIDADLIETALAGIDSDDEQERATELALKRAGQLSSYDNATATRRLTGFLMRKGYSSEVIRHAIDTAMADRIGRRGAASGGVRFR